MDVGESERSGQLLAEHQRRPRRSLYLTNSGFVSSYARTNEKEDFAESFSAYFLSRAQWPYNNGAGATGAPAKMLVFADWAGRIGGGG
jgi:hypothetical protein